MKPKKVLITGGAGFIGANLARRLAETSGFEVFIIERKGTDLWRLKGIEKNVSLHEVDLVDKEALAVAVKKVQPDAVFHFAGYGAYPASQPDVKNMVDVNIQGTLNLIDATTPFRDVLLVNIGSSSEYQEKPQAILETDMVDPKNAYGITKLASTLLVRSMAKACGINAITLRPFNVYGQGAHSDSLMARVILASLQNQPLILDSPDNVRDFIFIEDFVDLLTAIINSNTKFEGEIFNVGSGKEYSVKEVVEKIEKALNKKIPIQQSKNTSSYPKMLHFSADITKTQKTFHWKPSHAIDQGIEKTVGWFLEHKTSYASK